MGVIGSIDFVKADIIDGFEQVIGEVRFLYDFLRYKNSYAHYILPDKIMYDTHNVTISYDAPGKINLITVDHGRVNLASVSLMFCKSDGSLMFCKSDGSDLDLHLLTGYLDNFMHIRVFNDDALKKYTRSLDAFLSLLILRCRSAFEQGMPIGSAISDNINTPEFYYMSKDLYGVENIQDFLKQFMDWSLPFPDYILKTAVDTGDLEYAAALLHEKDALRMSGKEESLRL